MAKSLKELLENVPFVRSAYNYDRDVESELAGLSCGDPSRTQQQFSEECDINTIVRRFGVTGQVPTTLRAPLQGDFHVMDYHGAMNALVAASESFEKLPADVRYRFRNDPGLFVEFCSDEANRDEATKLGLRFPQAAAPAAVGASQGGAVAPGEAAAGASPGVAAQPKTGV